MQATVPQGDDDNEVLKEYCEMYETDEDDDNDDEEQDREQMIRRYCTPCNAPKPFRAHHCRYVPFEVPCHCWAYSLSFSNVALLCCHLHGTPLT